jgi:lysozyme
MTTVPGIDVSYWQSGIDWPKVRATGQRFALIKATEGEGYTDPTFEDNWKGAKAGGLLRGAYGFFHPNQDPKNQVDRFVKAVNALNDGGELPCILDLEVSDGLSSDKVMQRSRVWLDAAELAFGRKPIIYSSVSFLETSFSEPGGGPPAWTRDYPLWIGWFPGQYNPGMSPLMPRGWFKWTFWQYSGKGSVNGINASVDLDIFNGTLDELYRLAGVPTPDQTPKSHVVALGDSFESVANKYGVTLSELTAANPQLLKIGDKLNIPVAIEIPSSAPRQTYTVQRGDTLYAIAVRFGTTVPALAAQNNITDPNIIQVGQVLAIS